MPSDQSLEPITVFRVLTDPAEADEAFDAGVCWCDDEYMDPGDQWYRPSESWKDYTYMVRIDWQGETTAAGVKAGSSDAEFIATLNGIGKAPEHDPDLDNQFVEFDFVVPVRDRERTDALLRALVDAGWLATDVIASRGVDLDETPAPAPADDFHNRDCGIAGGWPHPASAHDEKPNG